MVDGGADRLSFDSHMSQQEQIKNELWHQLPKVPDGEGHLLAECPECKQFFGYYHFWVGVRVKKDDEVRRKLSCYTCLYE